MPKQKFIALMQLWHSKEEKYYNVGDEVDLSHLNPAQVEVLKDMRGVIDDAGLNELTRVNGIGKEYAKALAVNGIVTLGDLVKANPQKIENAIGAISLRQVQAWQADAKSLLKKMTAQESASDSPAPAPRAAKRGKRKEAESAQEPPTE